MIGVSVLIPVYGVEKYIERCARSLFEQTMKTGIEFIFTDDCTPDNSIEIVKRLLEDYPERKDQVKFIRHETNQGLAVARVTGLHAASGEYVIHCDSDDWVEPDMYELLYAKAIETHAHIVGCDFFVELFDRSKVRKQDFSQTQQLIIMGILTADKIDGYLWNRMIRRNFYLGGAYKALKGTTFLEDLVVTVPMHRDTKEVSYVNKPLYHYNCSVPFSMSTFVPSKKVLKAIDNLNMLKDGFKGNESVMDAINYRIYVTSLMLIFNLSDYKPEEWLKLNLIKNKNWSLSKGTLLGEYLIRHRCFYLHFFLRRLLNSFRYIFNCKNQEY